jgi:Fe-S-cluster containining protein
MSDWYASGLRFECTRCGNCCTGAAGTVLVSDDEIEALATGAELSNAEFREVYTRSLRDGSVSLRERRDGSCVFYQRDRGCTVHPLRPRQCRTWPFWRGVAASEESWNDEAERCPGMNRGLRHEAHEIAALAADDGTLSSHRARQLEQ